MVSEPKLPRTAGMRYYVTGVAEDEAGLVIQIVFVGDDLGAAIAAGNAARGSYDRVILKDREHDAIEL